MKTRIWLYLLLLFFTQLLSAQAERALHYGTHFNIKQSKQIFDDPEMGTGEKLFGFSLGLDLFYDIHERIQLVTGMNYNFTQVNQIDYSLNFACDFNGIEVDHFNTWSADEFKIHSLGIPLGVRFKLIGQENHLYLKTGLEAIFKIGTSSKSVIWECGTNPIEIENSSVTQLQNSLLKVQGGLGFEIRVSKKMKIYFEPQIEYSTGKVFRKAGTVSSLNNNSHLLELGFLVGTRM